MKVARLIALILGSLALAFVLNQTLRVSAQSNCQPPPLTGLGGWTQGAIVSYQISSNANSTEVAQINQAFNNWSGANNNNGSLVGFINLGTNSGPPQVTVTLCNTAGCAGGHGSEVFLSPAAGNPVNGARIIIDITMVPDSDNDILRVSLHEIGHTMGLNDEPGANGPTCGQIPGGSVMNAQCGTSFSNVATFPTSCDQTSVSGEPGYAPPPPSGCNADSDCPTSYTCDRGVCTYNPGGGGAQCTPIILAVGDTPDYDLTSVPGGVSFDTQGTGIKHQMAWTQAGAPVGFLVSDIDNDGVIDSGREMFGNHTLLPNGEFAPNGFLALGAYDQPQNGGNGDGVIDARDTVWSHLRLWIDWNHNGISEPSEIYRLDDFGITQISLDYTFTNRRDKFGNFFSLQAPFIIGGKTRMAYDVSFAW